MISKAASSYSSTEKKGGNGLQKKTQESRACSCDPRSNRVVIYSILLRWIPCPTPAEWPETVREDKKQASAISEDTQPKWNPNESCSHDNSGVTPYRQEEVYQDQHLRAPGNNDSSWNFEKRIPTKQDRSGGVDDGLRAHLLHGDADVSEGQGRAIIESIAEETHHPRSPHLLLLLLVQQQWCGSRSGSRSFQSPRAGTIPPSVSPRCFSQQSCLGLGKQLAVGSLDLQNLGDTLDSYLCISTEESSLNPQVLQTLHTGLRLWPQSVSHKDHASDLLIDRDEYN
mmetsp:Transcript_38524/g.58134  ORF Transcript_38524/g.58134 Transcript_38524/m.58134 type:complete len:284 (-) Transcript_38524:59-910(-)